jgi:hypothetical protein
MFASIAAAALAAATPATIAEHQVACAGKDGWSDPAPPIKIFANVYDVGTCPHPTRRRDGGSCTVDSREHSAIGLPAL